MPRRPFTPAAGLVLVYVAFIQCGFALDIAMSIFRVTFAPPHDEPRSTSARRCPIAKWLTGLTATLSTVGLLGFMYLALPSDSRDVARGGLPVGLVALFTVAMIALAHFESRRELEHDIAPARVI